MRTNRRFRVAQIACVMLFIPALLTAVFGRERLPDGIVLGAGVLMFALFATFVILEERRRVCVAKQQQNLPEVIEPATIVSRRLRPVYQPSGRTVRSSSVYCLRFETAKHGTLELIVDWQTWRQNPDGTQGQLRFRGDQFLGFKKR